MCLEVTSLQKGSLPLFFGHSISGKSRDVIWSLSAITQQDKRAVTD